MMNLDKNSRAFRSVSLSLLLFSFLCGWSQDSLITKAPWSIPEVKVKFNSSGTRYFQFTGTLQIWNRLNQSNPGTMVEGERKPYTFDIGIRRLRLWTVAKPLDWMTLAVQFGINNFNSLSPRKAGDFFHDAYIEFHPAGNYFSIGSGLVSSMGHARYSSPAVSSILACDAPLYQQSTNDVTDQFLRKLSIFVRGQVKGFDYRMALSDPMSIRNSAYYDPVIESFSKFTPKGKSLQYTGYFQWMFFDKEKQVLPYFTGTYLGNKKLLNIGAGAEFQPRANWRTNETGDTLFHHMLLVSADVFVDLPLSKRKDDCFTFYGVYSYLDFGRGYVRNLGVMNPGQTLDNMQASFNGTGNAYPMIGSGHTLYFQAGYKLPSHWFGGTGFSMQPYADVQSSKFNRLKSWALVYDAGVNFLLVGHKAKITLNYQNRPVFDAGTLQQSQRKHAVILQWQMAI